MGIPFVSILIILMLVIFFLFIIYIIVSIWGNFDKKTLNKRIELYKKENMIIVPEGKVSCLNCSSHFYHGNEEKSLCFYDDTERNKYTGEIIKKRTGVEKNINGDCKFYTETNWKNEMEGEEKWIL